MVTKTTKAESGVYRALQEALNNKTWGKIAACYVIANLTGADFRESVRRYKAERQASEASEKQALYAARLLQRAKLDEDRFQALRIFLVKYIEILEAEGLKPRAWKRKTWIKVEREGCFAEGTPQPELLTNF